MLLFMLMNRMLLIASAAKMMKFALVGTRSGPITSFELAVVILARRIFKRPLNILLLDRFAVDLLPHSLLLLVGDPGGDIWGFFTDCIAVRIDRSAST